MNHKNVLITVKEMVSKAITGLDNDEPLAQMMDEIRLGSLLADKISGEQLSAQLLAGAIVMCAQSMIASGRQDTDQLVKLATSDLVPVLSKPEQIQAAATGLDTMIKALAVSREDDPDFSVAQLAQLDLSSSCMTAIEQGGLGFPEIVIAAAMVTAVAADRLYQLDRQLPALLNDYAGAIDQESGYTVRVKIMKLVNGHGD